MIERVLKLGIPTLYGWVFLFYLLFHVWLNLLAELTLFADREFYKVSGTGDLVPALRPGPCMASEQLRNCAWQSRGLDFKGPWVPCSPSAAAAPRSGLRASQQCSQVTHVERRTGGMPPPLATTGACGTCLCTSGCCGTCTTQRCARAGRARLPWSWSSASQPCSTSCLWAGPST